MTPLTLEEFAFRVLWLEHMRLSQFISEHEAQKHFRKTLAQCRRGDNMLLQKDGTRSEWTVIVEARYRYYLEDLQDQNNAPDSPCAAMHFLTDAMKHVLAMDDDWETLSYPFELLRVARESIHREVYPGSYERNYGTVRGVRA